MKSTRESTNSFVVRIWLEPREIKDAEPVWRGVIEHVGSGDRIYFHHLSQIAMHLMPYIEAMGITVDKP